jgi:predicted nucleic acid-binding protein
MLFADLCRRADAVGNLAADAYLAALAIESGCEWISFDRDYARFPGLTGARRQIEPRAPMRRELAQLTLSKLCA